MDTTKSIFSPYFLKCSYYHLVMFHNVNFQHSVESKCVCTAQVSLMLHEWLSPIETEANQFSVESHSKQGTNILKNKLVLRMISALEPPILPLLRSVGGTVLIFLEVFFIYIILSTTIRSNTAKIVYIFCLFT